MMRVCVRRQLMFVDHMRDDQLESKRLRAQAAASTDLYSVISVM